MDNDEDLQAMVHHLISEGAPADMSGRALAWWEKVEDLLAVLRKTMPELLKEFGL